MDEFALRIGAQFDEKSAEKQWKEFSLKKRTIKAVVDIDGEKAFKGISTYVNKIGQTIKTEWFSTTDGTILSNTIKKVDTDAKKLNNTFHKTKEIVETFKDGLDTVTKTTFKQLNENGEEEKIVKTIREHIDEKGRLIQTTKVYNETLQQSISYDEKIIDNAVKRGNAIKNVKNITQEYNTLENGFITAVKEEIATTTKANGEIETVTKTTKSWKDANGYLHESITTVDKDGKQVGATIENIKKAEQGTAKQTQEFGQQAQTLGERFANMVKNFATFYVATLPTQLFRQAISESVQLVKDFDNALIEFQKVSSYSGETLDAYTDKLARMGEVTGSTMTAMVEASTEFKKSGYSEEDSAELASIAEMYRNIADEEISAGDSATFIIAQMKAFGDTAEDARHYIDGVYLQKLATSKNRVNCWKLLRDM